MDLFTLHFALANYLQQNLDCEIFAVIDTTNKPKSFFSNQKIVNFKNSWFYHDHIDTKKPYTDNSIENFTEKYKIDLKKLIQNDRHLNHYNEFFVFTDEEKKSIVTQECELYENIINNCKPDFLIIAQPALRHSFMLYHICKENSIIPLVINPSLLGYQSYVSSFINKLDSTHTLDIHTEKKSFKELRQILKKFNANTQMSEYLENYGKSNLSLVKAAYEFLFKNDNTNEKTHYTYFGRTKTKVLSHSLKNKIEVRRRKNFIDKAFVKKISDDNIIYFPLHAEPDRNILLDAPDFVNQLESIKNIVNTMPLGYKLYVKEHPAQNRTWRKISYYKKILELSNVVLVHPYFPSSEIFKKCKLVITAVGTSGFEASFYGIPVITFGNTLYSDLSSVSKMESFSDLQNLIMHSLEKNPSPLELESMIQVLQKNSVNFDMFGYHTLQAREFFHDSNLIDVEIPEEKMINFLKNNLDYYKIIGEQIIKKINFHSNLGKNVS